jgi:hypothetical protein
VLLGVFAVGYAAGRCEGREGYGERSEYGARGGMMRNYEYGGYDQGDFDYTPKRNIQVMYRMMGQPTEVETATSARLQK